MKYKSAMVTQASGSVGGMTAAHNRGGLYMRARAIPVNPNTAAQQAARNAMSNLSTAWSQTLTAAQREAWKVYAEATPITDALGDPLVLSGQQMYLRCNTPRVRAGQARVDDGPTTMGMAELGNLAFASFDENSPGTVDITWSGSPAWADEDDAFVIVQASMQKSPALNFFKGPYRFADTIDGDSVTAPTSPATVTTPFVFTAGNKAFGRLIVSRADGRISPALEAGDIIAGV